jgi:hypothetical protein
MLRDNVSIQQPVSRLKNQLEQRLENPNQSHRNLPKAQEAIYEFLLEIVRIWTPEDVLKEFKHLFIHPSIHPSHELSTSVLPHLYNIVSANQEQEFTHTLKRSCYILINNWDISRNHEAIQNLIQLFSDPIVYKHTVSPTLKRLREWLRNFVASSDFQQLKLFAARYEDYQKVHWSQRYASYLLVPQYTNLENPLEQRQVARNLSQKLKEKFKFELAMYTALSQEMNGERKLENPTSLGDEVLYLIKRIVAKRGVFSYPNVAHIFLNQTQNLSYAAFKQSLLEYLIFSVEQNEFTKTLKHQLAEKLKTLYSEHDNKEINNALLLRTANRLIDYLTTENQQEPSALFVLLLSQGNSLTLVVVLLKLLLICGYARTHLETRIASLIHYYADYSEAECRWVVNFFEMFRIVTAIYTENIEYNLVNMNEPCSPQTGANQADTKEIGANPVDRRTDSRINAGTYRIFSQQKRQANVEREPDLLEVKMLEASLETASSAE